MPPPASLLPAAACQPTALSHTALRRRFLRSALGLAPASLGLAALSGCATGPTETGAGAEPAELAPQPSLPPFSTAEAGAWPPGWAPYVVRRDLPRTRYELVRDSGRQVLRARARQSATGLHCALQPSEARPLAFSWKVARAEARADLSASELDDAPARLVVAFDGDHSRLPLRDRLLFEKVELFTGQRLPYAMLMYVWGGPSNPVESVHANHRTARIQYLTVESGPARVGQWLSYQRDLAQDFERVFGERAGPVISIGVLTDGDALKLDFEAWYGDITLAPLPG